MAFRLQQISTRVVQWALGTQQCRGCVFESVAAHTGIVVSFGCSKSNNFCPAGVAVNGQLVGSKRMKGNKVNTYFGTISVYYQPLGLGVSVGTDQITLTDGTNNHNFTWRDTADIAQDG